MSPFFNFFSSDSNRFVGHLISYDNDTQGEYIELSKGRWAITSDPTQLESEMAYIHIDHPSICSLHALILVSSSKSIKVLDQLSKNGTSIIKGQSGKEVNISGSLGKAKSGDKIRFGERVFELRLTV